MTRRTVYRLQDIIGAIGNMRRLLNGLSFEQMSRDPAVKAAFERFLEIVSEASRHVPDELKLKHGADVPWRQVADIGDLLSHSYYKSDIRTLWDIYENELGTLEAAVLAMLDDIGEDGD